MSIITFTKMHIHTLEFKNRQQLNFPGGPVVKSLHFRCRGRRFDPRSGNSACCEVWPKIDI